MVFRPDVPVATTITLFGIPHEMNDEIVDEALAIYGVVIYTDINRGLKVLCSTQVETSYTGQDAALREHRRKEDEKRQEEQKKTGYVVR